MVGTVFRTPLEGTLIREPPLPCLIICPLKEVSDAGQVGINNLTTSSLVQLKYGHAIPTHACVGRSPRLFPQQTAYLVLVELETFVLTKHALLTLVDKIPFRLPTSGFVHVGNSEVHSRHGALAEFRFVFWNGQRCGYTSSGWSTGATLKWFVRVVSVYQWT